MGTRATAAEIDAFMRDNDCRPTKRAAVGAGDAPRVETLDEPYVSVTIPVRTPNPLNSGAGRSQHWRPLAKEAARQRDFTTIAFWGVSNSTWRALSAGCVVTMTRLSVGTLADDALPGALKHVRDVIAQHLFGGTPGERDDDPRATWECQQLRCGRGEFGVIVSVRKRT